MEPSREVFYNLYFARVLLIAYLLFIWILPILSSIVMRIHLPYDKLIQMSDFSEIDDENCEPLGIEKFFMDFHKIDDIFICPYFLFYFLDSIL